jgi:alkanesulfonate monooxygenase SsuD/methylene tetrahydromethanopterin reductase-like flavin-dependent oxidoreductase (luciferase family)
VRFGAFTPYIVDDPVDRNTFLAWCEGIDAGPFGTIAHGERTRWHTLEHFTALGGMAVATERVRIWSHTLNVPMHPTAFLAKRAASIDILSDGRYTICASIGGRPQDWLASEKPYIEFPHATMDRKISEMRRMWNDELPADGGEKVYPLPKQKGGPPILCTAQAPKGLARAARWADGYAGFIAEHYADADQARVFLLRECSRIRDAWVAAGRNTKPYLSTSCFYGLGKGARERLAAAGGGYRRNRNEDVVGDEFWVHNEDAVRDVVLIAEEAGFDHVIFIPTSHDVGELEALAAVLRDVAPGGSDGGDETEFALARERVE